MPRNWLCLQALLVIAVTCAPALAADSSVVARLEARGIEHRIDADGDAVVTLNYDSEGRTQLAFVSGGVEQIRGFTVREVFSPAARIGADGIDGGRALSLLAESSSNKLGSWEIRGDGLYFVIKLPDTLDAEQLEAAIAIAAETADDMEIELSGDRDAL